MFLLQSEITTIFKVLELIILAAVIVLFFILLRSMPKSKDNNADLKRLMKKINLISTHALRSNIYNEELSDFQRMEYYYQYIIEGGNGNTMHYAVKNIIGKSKENIKSWNDITAKKPDPEDVMDYEAYKKTLEDIKRIFL